MQKVTAFVLFISLIFSCISAGAADIEVITMITKIIINYNETDISSLKTNKLLSANLARLITTEIHDNDNLEPFKDVLGFYSTIESVKGRRAFLKTMKLLNEQIMMEREKIEELEGGQKLLDEMTEILKIKIKVDPEFKNKLKNDFLSKERIFSDDFADSKDKMEYENAIIKFKDNKDNDDSWIISGFEKNTFIDKFNSTFQIEAKKKIIFIRTPDGEVMMEAFFKDLKSDNGYAAKFGLYHSISKPEDDFNYLELISYSSLSYYEVAISEKTLNTYPKIESPYKIFFMPKAACVTTGIKHVSDETKDILNKHSLSITPVDTGAIIENNSPEDLMFVSARDPLDIFSLITIGMPSVTKKGRLTFIPRVILRNGEPASEFETAIIDLILKDGFGNARKTVKTSYPIKLKLREIYMKNHEGNEYLIFVGGKKREY